MGLIYVTVGMSLESPKKIKMSPSLSIPLRPALPHIYVYSPDFNNRNPWPSILLMVKKITDFVGTLIPMAKLSVANNNFKRFF